MNIALLLSHGGSKKFSVRTIPDICFWAQAGTGVTTVGETAAVSAWLDNSPYAMHLAQSDFSGQRPTLVPDGMNGKPVIRALGDNSGAQFMLSGIADGFGDITGLTLIVVCSIERPTSNGFMFASFQSIVDQLILRTLSSRLWIHTYYDQDGYNGTLPSTSPQIITIVYDGSQSGNSGRLKMRINGTPQSLSYDGTITSVLHDVGKQWGLNTYDPVGSYGTGGDYAEIVAVKRACTEEEISYLETGFGSEYGITVA